MKKSDYFLTLLENQSKRKKIWRNSHCDVCLSYDNLKMVRLGDNSVRIMCEVCANQRKTDDPLINISYKKLNGNVTDNYTKTLKGWTNKFLRFSDLSKIVSRSDIQYSPYAWDNGHKIPKQFNRSKQTHITIDVDDGLSIEDFKKIMYKYEYCLSTTKSHQIEKKGKVCDRFRCTIKATNISDNDDIYFKAMLLIFPFNDTQTLTKTASFLGCDRCYVYYNDGIPLDMKEANELAVKKIEQEKKEIIMIDKDLLSTNNYGSSLEAIRAMLDRETVRRIAESIGIEFEGFKCSLRDERTKSCKLYESGMFKDFGGTFSGDIFKLLMDREGMTFYESRKYVENFI